MKNLYSIAEDAALEQALKQSAGANIQVRSDMPEWDNGSVNLKTRDISVSDKADTAFADTVKHETTHLAERYAPEQYKDYEKSIINAALQNDAAAVERRRQSLLELGYSSAEVDSELAAELAAPLLNNRAAIERLARSKPSFSGKMADVVASAAAHLKNLSGNKYVTDNGITLTYPQMQRAEFLWRDAVRKSGAGEGNGGEAVRYSGDKSDSDMILSRESRQAAPEADASLEQYSYNALISKPDMPVTLLTEKVPLNENGKIDRAKVKEIALTNARKQNNPKNTEANIYVHVNDLNKDFILNAQGLRHGLTRNVGATANVTLHIADILNNSIAINEINPRGTTAGGYILLGIGKDVEGNYYPTRIVVNNYQVDEIELLGVVYAIKAKKEGVARLEDAGNTAKSSSYRTTPSIISITDLLDIVKSHFPDTMPQNVLQHYNMTRPNSPLSDSARFSRRFGRRFGRKFGRKSDSNKEYRRRSELP